MKLHQFRLPNDIPAVAYPMPSTMSVCLAVSFSCGSRYESKEQNGMAHFLEHLLFRGSKRYPDIARVVEGAGGRKNGFTAQETILYFTHVPDGKSKLAAQVLSDMLIRPLFRPSDIETERGVVEQELRGYLQDSADRAEETAMALYFQDHPMGQSIGGPIENLAKWGREDIRAFFQTFYCAERANIALAGNVDVTAISALLSPFEIIPQHVDCQRVINIPSLPVISRVAVRRLKQREQAYFFLILPGPVYAHSLRRASSFATDILGQGMSSRLERVLRDELGFVYHVGASLNASQDYGIVAIVGATSPGQLMQCMRRIIEELRLLSRAGVTRAEYLRAKSMRTARIMIASYSPENIARRNAAVMALGMPVYTPHERIEHERAVRHEEVNEAARLFLNPSVVTLAVAGNVKESEQELLDIIQNA